MRMEALNRLQPPCLSLLALCLTPAYGFPVGCQDEAGGGVGDFKALAARFVDIQEKCLLDGVFVGSCFDKDAVFEADIGSQQHLFGGRRGRRFDTGKKV